MLWRPTTFSSWIIITSWCHLLLLCCCGIYAFCQFTRWLPRLCSPMLASQGPASVWSCGLYAMRLNSCTCLFTEYAERRRQVFAPQCTIGTSPLFDSRDGFQMRALSFSHHRVSPDLSAMASSILVVDPSDTTSRKQKSNLRVAWRGSQRVNYLCMLCCM